MTEDEGKKAGVDNCRLHFRVGDGKGNMAPPSNAATWYRLEGVPLGNANGKRPQDEVGVVTSWTWPDAFDGLPDDALAKAQGVLEGNNEGKGWRADPQAHEWAGWPICKALGLKGSLTQKEERIKTLLTTWTKQGHFETYEAKDLRHKTRTFIRAVTR